MATISPLNGLPAPDDGSPNDPPIHFQALIDQIDSRLVPRFSSTGQRDTAYAAWVAAGGVMENGMLCSAAGVPYRRIGGTWRIDRPRKIPRNTGPFNAGAGSVISSGGANQTGATAGIAALANFTLYEAGTVELNATFRGGGAGAMQCTVWIDGAQVGDIGVTRSDVTCSVVGTAALAAGSHTVSMRAEAIGGSVTWYFARLVISEGIAE